MHDNTELDIRRLLGPIRRRLPLVIGTVVVVMLATTLIVFSLTSLYTARALVFVDTSSKNLLEPQVSATYSGTESARVDSEVEIMRSEAVLKRVVEQNDLLDDTEFNNQDSLRQKTAQLLRLTGVNPPAVELQDVMASLRRRVSVSREGATFVIAVNVTSREPEKAAKLANSLVDVYISTQVDAKVQSALAARDVLQRRIEQASAAVTESERLLDHYINDILSSPNSGSATSAVEQLRKKLTAARERRAEAVATMVAVSNAIERGNWSGVGEALQSQVVGTLYQQREIAAAVLEGGDPRRAETIRTELAKIDEELNTAARQVLDGLKQTVSHAEADEADLRQQIRTIALEGNLPPDVLTELYRLQQGAEIRRSQFQVLLSRLRDVETQADLQVADSRLVSAAMPPVERSFPKASLILGGAFFVAGLLGGALAILKENFLGGIITQEQAEEVLGVPLVLSVPLEKVSPPADVSGASQSVSDLMVSAQLSSFAEAIRRIRFTLDQIRLKKKGGGGSALQRGTIITVTSAAPGEGKTTTSISLARSYAQAGTKTLLIDCDLRRPSVKNYLGITSARMLGDCIGNGSGTSSSNVYVDPATGLFIIPNERNFGGDANALVDNNEFERFLEKMRDVFDVIMIDSPPIGPVVDGLYLASRSQIVVVVVNWAETPVDQVRATMNSLALARSGEVDFCVVINKVPRPAYGSDYSYYHV